MSMRKALLPGIIVILLLPCCKSSGPTVNVVKPKYHHSWFNHKKDKKVKRVKTVRMRQ
jgi:hypothetical protein